MMETRPLQDDDLNFGLFASNTATTSSKWSTKTPQEILDDVNALLASVWANSANEEWSPLANGGLPMNGMFVPSSYLMIPPWSFWFLKRHIIELLLRSRRRRRPERFTRRLSK